MNRPDGNLTCLRNWTRTFPFVGNGISNLHHTIPCGFQGWIRGRHFLSIEGVPNRPSQQICKGAIWWNRVLTSRSSIPCTHTWIGSKVSREDETRFPRWVPHRGVATMVSSLIACFCGFFSDRMFLWFSVKSPHIYVPMLLGFNPSINEYILFQR